MKETDRNEQEMRAAFNEQVDGLLSAAERFAKPDARVRVGLESEVAIHGAMSTGELVRVRNEIVAEHSDFADLELGATQVEIRTPPIELTSSGGVSTLRDLYGERFAMILDSARRRGVGVLRVGANPFLPAIGSPRTDKPKYRQVPDHYNRYRSSSVDTVIGRNGSRVDIGDAAVVSLFQSFQVNLEARSLEDACDKMNRSFSIAAYLLAFSGNARFLNGTDTAMSDVRMLGWERSHDTRNICDLGMQDVRVHAWERSFDVRPADTARWRNELRVGLPGRYFTSIADYLDRAGTFPFILHNPDAALAISIGMTWLDTRVKFIGDSAVVELRLPSTQPTTDDEMMLALLYIGRLHYAQTTNEPLVPIDKVRENRHSAMHHGMGEPLWFLDASGTGCSRRPAKEGLRIEFGKASYGLEMLGLRYQYFDSKLAEMFQRGLPSQRVADQLRAQGVLSAQNEPISHGMMERALKETGMFLV